MVIISKVKNFHYLPFLINFYPLLLRYIKKPYNKSKKIPDRDGIGENTSKTTS